MLLRIISDLHIGRTPYIPPELDTDKDSVLCILGDTNPVGSYKYGGLELLNWAAKRFYKVIFLSGNHEYWGDSIVNTDRTLTSIAHSFGVVYLHRGRYVVIDDVLFTGGTLWTDLNKGDDRDKRISYNSMNDYVYINHDMWYGDKITPDNLIYEHQCTLKAIKKNLKLAKEVGLKPVVLTHHAPSVHSVGTQYVYSDINFSYYSNLEYVMKRYKPVLWGHGHIHSSKDYMVGDCRVVCNPRGNPGSIHSHNPEFNPLLVIEV